MNTSTSTSTFPESNQFITLMAKEQLDARAIENFYRLYIRYREGHSGKIPWAEIQQPDPSDLVPYEELGEAENLSRGRKLLDQLVVIRLNGGLGTSMHLQRAKSLIRVREGLSFLDLTARQILKLRQDQQGQIPWLLMNSFHTQADSLAALSGYALPVGDLPLDFMQSKVPRIDRATKLPTFFLPVEENWAPPGHGDIYWALWTSGLLEGLLERGYRWAFVANVDNLGATVEPQILGYLDQHHITFAMEVAQKTASDIKGGTLIRHRGRLSLLEAAQVEDGHLADFQDTRIFSVFNSNNLWFRLDTLLNLLQHRALDLPLIVNPKQVQDRAVIQLETAMGAAVGCFPSAIGLCIPRSRFIPVKTTSDLLVVQSDVYSLDEGGGIRPNPARDPAQGPPVVRLDARFYEGIDEVESRVPHPLSLLQCRRLTVEGEFYFGQKVRLEGEVLLRNTSLQPQRITDGTVLKEGEYLF